MLLCDPGPVFQVYVLHDDSAPCMSCSGGIHLMWSQKARRAAPLDISPDPVIMRSIVMCVVIGCHFDINQSSKLLCFLSLNAVSVFLNKS